MSSQQVRFGPRESRGWLLGMTTPQLLLGVIAAFTTTKILDGDTTGWSRAGWVFVAATCLTVAFLPLRGRTIVEYVPVVANFWVQRITGHDVYRGGVFRMQRTDWPTTFVLPGDLAHLQLIAFDVDGSDGAQVAVVKDPHAKTYTAVLALEGSTFSLLETSVRGSRVDAWGSLLAQLCSENAVISRIQVLERTVPDSGDALYRDAASTTGRCKPRTTSNSWSPSTAPPRPTNASSPSASTRGEPGPRYGRPAAGTLGRPRW